MLFLTAIEIIVSVFVLIGGFLAFLSGLGLLRLPDVYSRTHAAGKSSTLGVMSIIFAAFLFFLSEGIFNAKILLSIFFVFLTAPIASLMINRSAYRINVPLWKNSVRDDLKEVYEKENKETMDK